MSKFRLGLSVMFMVVITIIMTVQPIAAQGCFDASGAAIPCPATPATPPDRDADSVEDTLDRCPDQGGDVGNQGCPLVEGTAEASTGATINPNRPDPTGQCSLTTYESVGVNVRATPDLNAPVVEVLDPLQVYPVHAVIVVDGALWYRVANGWVSSAAVVVDGHCAARVVEIQRGEFSIAAGDSTGGLSGGISPETECFELFNGIRFCQTVLTASADDDGLEGISPQEECFEIFNGMLFCQTVLTASADDDGLEGISPERECFELFNGMLFCQTVLTASADDDALEGISPERECFELFNGVLFCHTILTAAAEDGATDAGYDVTVCGFGPGGVICTLNSFTIPEDPECPPEFCPPSPPEVPGGWPPGSDTGEGNAAPMCVDVLSSFSAASSASGVNSSTVAEQTADGSVRFSLSGMIVDPQPQPCRVHVFAPQADQEVDGSIPVDIITVQVELLPAVTPDGSAFLFFEVNTEGMPHVRVFNGVSTTPDGNTCIPMTHGDFTYCTNE